ncbi:hypothetical protein BWD13_19265 [Leptospira santarosai serovar Grippotyphosa]|nr:hypothetical protein BWD13_19265 [Leptospira santarosai serovar Grippotyphosa]
MDSSFENERKVEFYFLKSFNIASLDFKTNYGSGGVLLSPLRPDVSVGFQSLEGKLSKDRGFL